MKIKISAFDTLFFKDGKPFSMGNETWADGIYPPPPSVFYGALRTNYFASNEQSFSKANTDEDPTKNLKINNIYYLINDEIYYPLPYDCVKEKANSDKKVLPLSVKEKDFLTNIESSHILHNNSGNEVENVEGMIGVNSFKNYLKGDKNNLSFQNLSDLFLSEPKVGIGRENLTHSTSEGKLYRVGMIRPQKDKNSQFSFIVDFEGLELPENGYIKLGAEGKISYYSTFNDSITLPDLSEILKEKDFLKIILLTPAFFKDGWIPSLDDYGLTFITAAIGKPKFIGGFDMQNRKPKEMMKAVAPGSVYYYKFDINKIDILKELLDKSISFIREKEGFGRITIGGYKC